MNVPINKIFLIGLPGSGKSKLGKKLATYLQYEFIDTDTWIEAKEGKPVAKIFHLDGEDRFRLLERQAIQEICALPGPIMVATGGGLPCFHNNMELMNGYGLTVYLKVPIEILASRIASKEQRPLFTGLAPAAILAKLQNLQDDRAQYYRQARYTVYFNENILNQLKKMLEPAVR